MSIIFDQQNLTLTFSATARYIKTKEPILLIWKQEKVMDEYDELWRYARNLVLRNLACEFSSVISSPCASPPINHSIIDGKVIGHFKVTFQVLNVYGNKGYIPKIE